jgi:hypothetical protein
LYHQYFPETRNWAAIEIANTAGIGRGEFELGKQLYRQGTDLQARQRDIAAKAGGEQAQEMKIKELNAADRAEQTKSAGMIRAQQLMLVAESTAQKEMVRPMTWWETQMTAQGVPGLQRGNLEQLQSAEAARMLGERFMQSEAGRAEMRRRLPMYGRLLSVPGEDVRASYERIGGLGAAFGTTGGGRSATLASISQGYEVLDRIEAEAKKQTKMMQAPVVPPAHVAAPNPQVGRP